jgi:hypothetical protein
MVDLDESFVFLCEADRTHGYAFVGNPALVMANYVKGVKWTVMLALSYNGLVNYWIHRENTSGEVRVLCFFLPCILHSVGVR